MIGPFALMNEELQLYLINFHIAREVFRRGELPPEEVMDFLYERKKENLPLQAYDEETEHSKENLEQIIRLAVWGFAKGGTATRVLTEDGETDAISYERNNRTNILYVIKRVKGMKDYWVKSIINVDGQSQTGFFDHKGFRVIVESQEARQYRARRKFENLSDEERTRFRAEFQKVNFPALSPEERSRFYEMFSVGYKDLTDREKKEYNKKFQEPHKRICRDLAQRIALLTSMDTIPVTPHYMKLGGLDLRIQRQVITDYHGERVLEFEYILNRDNGNSKDLFANVLTSAAQRVLEQREGIARYVDLQGRQAYLISHGGIVINFHLYGDASRLDVEKLSNKIQDNYLAAKRHIKGEKSDESDTKIMKYVRLGIEDIPLGFFIFSDTTTRDLTEKYMGLEFDKSKTFETFVKDKIGTDPEGKERKYQDLKVYLCFNPESKQISGECQIRDTIMDHEAEFGRAKHSKHKEEKIATIDEQDMRIVSAFFDSDDRSQRILSQVYARFHADSILRIAGEVSAIVTIPEERAKFDSLAERVKAHFKRASQRVNAADLKDVKFAVEWVYGGYIKSKRMDIISYLDSLWVINEMLRTASVDSGASFRYAPTEADHLKQVYERHIHLLYHAFENLANSGKLENIAVSLFVGKLVQHYNSYYGNMLPEKTQRDYGEKVKTFWENKKGWAQFRLYGRLLGYVPRNILSGDRIGKSIAGGISRTLHNNPIINFDSNTIANVVRVYHDYTSRSRR